ncbi:MAG: LuxR C-terminal-related transcriptional regulator [Geodermatophilaceae bacterium]
MPDLADLLAAARASYARRDWHDAYRGLETARQRGSLAADDLHALADAAWWLGLIKETLAISEECHQHFLAEGRPQKAAMNALDIGFTWMLRGEVAIGSGWISRARRILEDQPDCAEQGFLVWLDTAEALEGGDLDAALVGARQIQEIGHRFTSPTLIALGLASEGLVTVQRGQVDKGFALLDEAMLPVLAGHVAPDWAGNIYCQLMGVCHDLADVRRARQWTAASQRWCEGFASAVVFLGVCRMHRIQLLQTAGQWSQAEAEASIACAELADMNVAVVAEAHYQLAELRMLADDLVAAEQGYQRAGQLGRDPQPGLALLRLAQGRTDDAAAGLRLALADSANAPFRRARLLAAYVEAALANDEVPAAARACADLGEIAARYTTPGFITWAGHARGAVLLAQGQPEAALPVLLDAHRRYCDIPAPYDAARVRVLVSEAYRLLGDADSAAVALAAATGTCVELGAKLQTRLLDQRRRNAELLGGLTAREIEVLAQITQGATNKEAAAALFISEKTVGRHLANIFIKLGVKSRTAAAAWANEHRLSRPRTG